MYTLVLSGLRGIKKVNILIFNKTEISRRYKEKAVGAAQYFLGKF